MRTSRTQSPRILFAFAFWITASAFGGRGSVYEMGEEFHTVTTAVATPHVAWARPLESGTLRLLVIAPRFAHRETAELMQRLDAQCDVVMTHSYKQIGTASTVVGMRENEVLDSLREQLAKPHDVILVGNFAWALIPKPLQYDILHQVANGTGLLYVPFTENVPQLFERLFRREPLPQFLLHGIPWGSLPSLASASEPSVLRFCGTLKRGRCLVVRWPGGAGGFHCLTPDPKGQIEYDYDLSLVARAVLWLAHREPKVSVRLRSCVETTGAVVIQAEGLLPKHQFDLKLRDAHGEIEWTDRPSFTGTDGSVSMPGRLKGGRHFLDLWVRSDPDNRIVTWASTYFDIKRDGRISAVRTERSHYRPPERVRVSVELAQPLTKPAQLVVSPFDVHGREWARVSATVAAGSTSAVLELRAEGMLSTYSRLRVDLLRDGQTVHRASGDLFVPLRRRPEFALGGWGGGGDSWLSHVRYQHGRRLGLDTVIFNGDIRADVRPTPYITSKFRHGGKGVVRKPCLTDPAFWQAERKHLHDRARSIAHADVFTYSLGDEICLDVGNTSVCRSPTCLAGFRAWLRKQYPTLAALNAEWDTAFANWAAVTPKSRKEAGESGNLAPWLDHRLFMDRVFAEGLNRARDLIHEIEPGVPVGAEGLWGSASAYGMDWWLITRKLDTLAPYWRRLLMRECIRSFKDRDCITGTWFGSYGEQSIDEQYLRWLPWNVLLHQFNSVWWYPEFRAVQFGAAATALAPDYRPTKGFRASLDEIAEIRSGVGALLLNLRRANDGIAVLYSRPCVHIRRADVGQLLIAIEDLGFQYDMVCSTQLSADWLRDHRYRLLVMPDICALSDAEAAEVTEFVGRGGRVLAMLPPGVYDEHGRPRAESVVNQLFGVEGLDAGVGGDIRKVQPADGTSSFEVAQTADLDEIAGATILATFDNAAPAAMCHRFGSGQAALLCFSFNGFDRARMLWQSELPMRRFLGSVMRLLEASPRIVIESPAPIRGLEVAAFVDGPNEYVAMTLEPIGPLRSRGHHPVQLELKMHERRLTYDVRARKALGVVDRVGVALKPGACQVFARLAELPPAPSVQIAPGAVPQGSSITVNCIAGGGLVRVLQLRVTRPDGTQAAWWNQNVVVSNGNAQVPLPVALNALPGEYVVTVRDAITGQTASGKFRSEED